MNGTESAYAAYGVITLLLWGYAGYLLLQCRGLKASANPPGR